MCMFMLMFMFVSMLIFMFSLVMVFMFMLFVIVRFLLLSDVCIFKMPWLRRHLLDIPSARQ